MADVVDPASLIEAAQQAAAGGDYPEAERLLREAAAAQESSLGSEHPDVATTLNNLAFVCERLNRFDEAERGYRRAHAIAVASLPPGDPTIATSLKNLVDFCAAHEIPIWKPPAAPVGGKTPPVAGTGGQSEAEVTRRWPLATMAAAALGVAAIAAVLFIRQGRDAADTSRPLPQAQQEPVQNVSTRLTPPPETTPDPPREPATDPRMAVTPELRVDTPKTPVTVLTARLCSALERTGSPDWQCTPASGDLQPGRYLLYTRLLTNAETTVEHRWYHGERVHQVMRLRLPPSPGNGYRTFSGNTVSPDRAGDWRVELRAADGTVLHGERFVVR
jgi:hypothetical protein